ncbi:MAG: DNA (cytosine-5-)-methyltransferase [Patescibacteria group bacterium]|nr:DNA (cytosine-5-)-methyltransferase [Patescibacteria group bacterium]
MRDTQTIDRECGTESANAHSVQRFVRGHGLKHLDLFSGIGGFALAAQAAGFETIGFAEIDNYASAILKRHWPNIPNYGDIRNIRGVPCDLITGGFPCQPFSHAGKRKGASDDRALWPEMCRVIADSRPAWVLGENVAGIINMELDRVLSDLEAIGYAAWPLVIPACALDAPHRRDRVWILAHRDGGSGSSEHGEQQTQRAALAGASGARNVADATRELPHGSGRARTARRAEHPNGGEDVSDDGCRCGERSRPCECGSEKPAGWQPEPDVGRMADGIPYRMDRLKGLGNSIVPQVAETILCNLARVMGNDQKLSHGAQADGSQNEKGIQ